jgi:hypothetical protein
VVEYLSDCRARDRLCDVGVGEHPDEVGPVRDGQLMQAVLGHRHQRVLDGLVDIDRGRVIVGVVACRGRIGVMPIGDASHDDVSFGEHPGKPAI